MKMFNRIKDHKQEEVVLLIVNKTQKATELHLIEVNLELKILIEILDVIIIDNNYNPKKRKMKLIKV